MPSRYLTVFACTMLLATPASALTILDTSPAGPLSPYGTPWAFVGGGSTYSAFEAAVSFTTYATYFITSVEFYGGGSGDLQANIRAGGSLPGAILHTATFTPAAQDQWNGVTGLQWILPAGTYFVGFRSPNSGSAIRMVTDFRNPAAQEMIGWGESWTPLAEVYNAPVWQRGMGIRATGDAAPSGVPELATWRMMILGLAAIGAALRGRPRGHKASAAV